MRNCADLLVGLHFSDERNMSGLNTLTPTAWFRKIVMHSGMSRYGSESWHNQRGPLTENPKEPIQNNRCSAINVPHTL
jgi:hypothetical protein